MTMDLPEVCARPCAECPWRRTAAAGWLGPHTAEEWASAAHGEAVIFCHTTVGGDESKERQCFGAATFRSNVFKSPRNPEISTLPADRENFFGGSREFIDYHTRRNRD